RVASRVVLDRHLHLDLGDVALTNHGRHDVEPKHRFLELDLCTGGTNGRVRNFFTERDRSGPVFDRHHLWTRQCPRLAEQTQRLQRKIDVVPAAGEAERDTAGAGGYDTAAEHGADGEIDQIAALRKARRAAHRKGVRESQRGVRRPEYA